MRAPTAVTLLVVVGILMLMAGCSGDAGREDTKGSGTHNFTVRFRCGNDSVVRLNVTGNAFMAVHEFARSNCSLHIRGVNMTVDCPRRSADMFDP